MTGVSPRVVALYETTIKFPTADIVMRLAKALDVSIDQLMGRRPVKTGEAANRKIIKKVKKLEELMPEDQKTILRMIDRFHNDSTRKR
jgi:transcriptional regulator with XRE-family HTH domain